MDEWKQAIERTRALLLRHFAGANCVRQRCTRSFVCIALLVERRPRVETRSLFCAFRAFAAADVDHSGTVSWDEFLSVAGTCAPRTAIARHRSHHPLLAWQWYTVKVGCLCMHAQWCGVLRCGAVWCGMLLLWFVVHCACVVQTACCPRTPPSGRCGSCSTPPPTPRTASASPPSSRPSSRWVGVERWHQASAHPRLPTCWVPTAPSRALTLLCTTWH
jgi:hypothetical protein